MNPQLEELKQEIPYNNDTDLGDFLSRKGVEEYINRTWNLAMERAEELIEENDPRGAQANPHYWGRTLRTAINKEKV